MLSLALLLLFSIPDGAFATRPDATDLKVTTEVDHQRHLISMPFGTNPLRVERDVRGRAGQRLLLLETLATADETQRRVVAFSVVAKPPQPVDIIVERIGDDGEISTTHTVLGAGTRLDAFLPSGRLFVESKADVVYTVTIGVYPKPAGD